MSERSLVVRLFFFVGYWLGCSSAQQDENIAKAALVTVGFD